MNENRNRFFSKKKPLQRPRPDGIRHPPAHPAHSSAGPATRAEPVWTEGILQLKGKFGFVLSEDPKVGDVMVQGPSLKVAMNGDRVRARVTSKPGEARRSGDISEVLVHSRQTVVGDFRRLGNLPVLVPTDD